MEKLPYIPRSVPKIKPIGVTNGLEDKYPKPSLSNGLEKIYPNNRLSNGLEINGANSRNQAEFQPDEIKKSFEIQCGQMLAELKGDETLYRDALAFVEYGQTALREAKDPLRAQISPDATQQLTLDHLRILVRLSRTHRR